MLRSIFHLTLHYTAKMIDWTINYAFFHAVVLIAWMIGFLPTPIAALSYLILKIMASVSVFGIVAIACMVGYHKWGREWIRKLKILFGWDLEDLQKATYADYQNALNTPRLG